MELSELRVKIDELDVGIVKLLEERFSLIEEIIKVKDNQGLKIEDKKREEEIIEKLSSSNLDKEMIKEIYSIIFRYAKNAQNNSLQE